MSNHHKMVEFKGELISTTLLSRLEKIEDTIKDLNDNKRMNMVDMAIHLKISESTIKKYIRLLGIKLHNRKTWSLADKSKWRDIILPMTQKGMLYEDIAKVVGASPSVVYNWCVREGIDRKTICHNWHPRHKPTK